MVTEVNDGLFDFNGYGIIVHAVDCSGIGYDRISRLISDKYPDWRDEYKFICKSEQSPEILLGHVNSFNAAYNVRICDAFDRIKPTGIDKRDDHIWERIFRIIEHSTRTENIRIGGSWSIHIPRLIGCNLGECEWSDMRLLIDYIFGTSPVKCVIHC